VGNVDWGDLEVLIGAKKLDFKSNLIDFTSVVQNFSNAQADHPLPES